MLRKVLSRIATGVIVAALAIGLSALLILGIHAWVRDSECTQVCRERGSRSGEVDDNQCYCDMRWRKAM